MELGVVEVKLGLEVELELELALVLKLELTSELGVGRREKSEEVGWAGGRELGRKRRKGGQRR